MSRCLIIKVPKEAHFSTSIKIHVLTSTKGKEKVVDLWLDTEPDACLNSFYTEFKDYIIFNFPFVLE